MLSVPICGLPRMERIPRVQNENGFIGTDVCLPTVACCLSIDCSMGDLIDTMVYSNKG
jgi:hypothetical protein